jgi:hypothetical protein
LNLDCALNLNGALNLGDHLKAGSSFKIGYSLEPKRCLNIEDPLKFGKALNLCGLKNHVN